ncbi:MAG: DUF1269 domain-containing protein [Thermoleophilia bacterium]
MATLTVWKFPSPTGADEAIARLADLQKQHLIQVVDAAVVSWPADRKKPKTRQLHDLAGAGAMTGAFWGFLFGLIFLVPLLGMAVGAAMGALSGKAADVGIDDRFVAEVREKVTPGTSALFLLSQDAVRDRVAAAFEGVEKELIATNLSAEQEAQLREAFADDED